MAWGLKPSEFFDSSEEDQALMMAHYTSRARMQAYEQLQREQEMERERQSPRRR